MKNLEIAKIFKSAAAILEIKGGNPFRIRAYERAALNIEGLADDIEKYLKENRLQEIPGIGADLAGKIKEYIETGKINSYEGLKRDIPEGLLELLDIPGVGPKTAKLLYDELKIKSVLELEEAINNNKLQGLARIKDKTVSNIQKGIEIVRKSKMRMPLAHAAALADQFVLSLKKIPLIKNILVAGSLRRQKETVRDIDILVVSKHPGEVMESFVKLSPVKEILAKGRTKSSIRTKDNIQVDCRVVEEKSFGAALLYFTGSKNFNIKLRLLAQKKGLKINEYGVFSVDKEREVYLAGMTEEVIFKSLGLTYIEPELREDTGEIELSLRGKLPRLIELKDIRGDLHAHSSWSDGGNSIEEMALAAKNKGYAYIAVTDHSQGLKVAGGLSLADLKKKKRQIENLNKTLKNFRVLYGAEVDIDSDGRLDYSDDVLKGFDVVVGAIHSGFRQSKERITKRLIKACENKYVHIIAHPTGRLWGTRDAYEIDFDEAFKAAYETNTYMEINSFPQRLDLNDLNCRRAKEMGVKLVINTDAHTTDQLEAMKLGVSTARRGWLTKNDVVNTLELEDFLQHRKVSI